MAPTVIFCSLYSAKDLLSTLALCTVTAAETTVVPHNKNQNAIRAIVENENQTTKNENTIKTEKL